MGEMTPLAAIIEKMGGVPMQSLSNEEYAQRRVDSYNQTPGDLKGYDCKKCLNRGHIAVLREGNEVMRQCECVATRKSLRQIEQSGLRELMTRCTFDEFTTVAKWRKVALQKAKSFLEDKNAKWFFAGGQVGAGKTHLCTAIVGAMLQDGSPARYMVWDKESKKLKSIVNDDAAYAKAIDDLQNMEVLYIDDFLKTQRGAVPTVADIKLAFEIVNYRYNNTSLTTLISSEFTLDEIMDFDEATGSRILERAGQYSLIVERDITKNWRIHPEKEETT